MLRNQHFLEAKNKIGELTQDLSRQKRQLNAGKKKRNINSFIRFAKRADKAS